MDIKGQKKKLTKQISIFTWIGGVSAVMALIPVAWAGYEVLGNHSFFKENELGDFIGGTSGTFASFAGLAFVYVAFLGQRLQILMQQEEIELNREEMKNTTKELEGQKIQLEIQNKNSSRQLLESSFYNALNIFKNDTEKINFFEIYTRFNHMLLPLTFDIYQGDFGEHYHKPKPGAILCNFSRGSILDGIERLEENEKYLLKQGLKLLTSVCVPLHPIRNEDASLYEILVLQIPNIDTVLFFYAYFYFFDNLSDFERDRIFQFLQRINPKILICEEHFEWIAESPFDRGRS